MGSRARSGRFVSSSRSRTRWIMALTYRLLYQIWAWFKLSRRTRCLDRDCREGTTYTRLRFVLVFESRSRDCFSGDRRSAAWGDTLVAAPDRVIRRLMRGLKLIRGITRKRPTDKIPSTRSRPPQDGPRGFSFVDHFPLDIAARAERGQATHGGFSRCARCTDTFRAREPTGVPNREAIFHRRDPGEWGRVSCFSGISTSRAEAPGWVGDFGPQARGGGGVGAAISGRMAWF